MDPRRSSRRPPYPTLPTAATSNSSSSAFQHSTSSISSAQSARSSTSTSGSSAPLPSPTVGQGEFFFGSMHGQMSQQQMLDLQQLEHLQQQQMAAAQQAQQAQQQMVNYNYRPDRSGAGATAQETDSYINQYALVAEAARRAQMAVLERELEGIELG